MSDITSRWCCGLAVPMPESRYSDSEVCLFGLLSQWHDGDAGLFVYLFRFYEGLDDKWSANTEVTDVEDQLF